MYNYSARPWVAIGLFVISLSSFFYFRIPTANDIIPLWIIVFFMAFASFFASAYIVDHLMIFPSKYLLHEVYAPAAAIISAAPPSAPILSSPPYPATSSSEFTNDVGASVATAAASVSSSSSTAISTAPSSSYYSSSTASKSLRPRNDVNEFMMY